MVVRTEELLESIRGLPSIVVGNLGRDVVSDVSLADTVEEPSTDRPEHVSVNGSKGTSGESPLVSGVVGQKRVGVLEVSDEDEPATHQQLQLRKQCTYWLTQRYGRK